METLCISVKMRPPAKCDPVMGFIELALLNTTEVTEPQEPFEASCYGDSCLLKICKFHANNTGK